MLTILIKKTYRVNPICHGGEGALCPWQILLFFVEASGILRKCNFQIISQIYQGINEINSRWFLASRCYYVSNLHNFQTRKLSFGDFEVVVVVEWYTAPPYTPPPKNMVNSVNVVVDIKSTYLNKRYLFLNMIYYLDKICSTFAKNKCFQTYSV